MKRLFVIILLLCTWVAYPMLHAQGYTTSSATYRSVCGGGMAVQPSTATFRSTSSYAGRSSVARVAPSRAYSTAPMYMANGTITTVASQLQGGELAETPSSSNGFSPQQRAAVIPGVPYPPQPLSDGWDVALLLSLLCLGYAVYLKRKTISNNTNA